MTRFAPTAIKSLLFGCFCCATATLNWSTAHAQAPNSQPQLQSQARQIQTLAVVNGQEVTRQQIADECMRRFGKDTLKSIVNKLLVAVECENAGISITEKDINDEIIGKAKKFGMSGERYIKTICSRRSISVDEFKNNFVWNELALRRLAAQQIKVTPDELSQRMEFEYGNRVQIRQIVVESMQLAQKLQAQAIAQPQEFERLAKEFSVDQVSKAVGGLIMHAVRRNGGFPELEDLVFSLKEGEVSRVLPVAENFVIFRCEKIIPGQQVAPEQMALIHERLSEQISNEKLNAEASKLFDRLEQTTEIVNVLNDAERRQQMPGVAAIVNNHKVLINQVAEECISRFGNDMLDTEINRAILLQAMKQKGVSVSEENLNQEIYRAAKSFGFLNKDQSVNETKWLNYVTKGDAEKEMFYIEDEVWPTVALKELVRQSVSVTKEDIQKSFEANYGPRVEVLAIVANDHRKALSVWSMASANPTREYFGELAHQYSIEPASQANYGVVPPIQRHGGRPELEKEAFNLNRGEISKVVQVGEHWIMLLCLGRTEPVVTDLDAVRDDLSEDIMEKKLRLAMSQEFQKLRANAQIDNFLKGTSQPGRAAIQKARRQTQTMQK